MGLVVGGDALAVTGAAEENLYACIAEDGIPIAFLDSCPGCRFGLVEAGEGVIRHLLDLGPLLRVVLGVVGSEGSG